MLEFLNMATHDSSVDLKGIAAGASETVLTFAQEIIPRIGTQLESLAITGSCLTGDYIPGRSDINSLLVLREITVAMLDKLAYMGKRFGKKHVRAPLIMTQEYIDRSLDVFPIEFLDIKLIHKTIYGKELFVDLAIDKSMLRLQCERDLKAKLIKLRQGYLSCAGNKKDLTLLLFDTFPGFFPLFRAMLYIAGINKALPILKMDVLTDIESSFAVSIDVLREIHSLKASKKVSLSHEQANRLFNEVYRITHEFSLKMDRIS
ncbi:MAG: hypothetical protein JXM72_03565 [Deltaproteobacteria bacterium]|nr:hypothetical protein [Deltaproteobacteria bacterium]